MWHLTVQLKTTLYILCRYSQSQPPNETNSICVFGEHESKQRRSSVVVFNSKHEETVIAETDYRQLCSVACLNGESFVCIFHNRVRALAVANFNVCGRRVQLPTCEPKLTKSDSFRTFTMNWKLLHTFKVTALSTAIIKRLRDFVSYSTFPALCVHSIYPSFVAYFTIPRQHSAK